MNDKVELSKVVVGCMRAKDAGMEGQNFLRFVQECLELGITSFDHAPVYGFYTCEKLFGDSVLRKIPGLRDQMKIISKAGIVLPGINDNKVIYYDSSKEEILKEVDKSLENLATDHLDLLLIHRPDPLADPCDTAEALEQLVKAGKVLSVGVSNYMPSQITMLQSYLKVPIVTNQMELSVKTTENFFNGVTEDAFTRKIPLMSWSPLGGGSLFNAKDEQAARLNETLGQIAKEHETSMDVIMYAWLFVHPVKIAAITGSMNIERIKKAVDALKVRLSYDEWYRILAASRGYDVP